MKLLNFGKVKKAWNSFKKFIGIETKKTYKEEKKVVNVNQSQSGSYNNRKGGLVNYKFKLIPLNKIFPVIYRDFKRQKLTGSLIVIGKCTYRIIPNN